MIKSRASLHHLLTILFVFVAAVAIASPVPAEVADTRARPVPAALTQIVLVAQSQSETKLQLALAPKSNGFGVVGDGTAASGLGLALTSRTNSAVAPAHLTGFLHAISFEQVDTVLILHFATGGAASVKAIPVSPTTVEVTVSAAGQAASARHDEAGGPAIVPSAEEPMPGEDAYELVMLKYADVSEVVGLLTDQTIKSNDVFIPHEPAFGSNSLTGGNNYSFAPGAAPPGSDDQALGQGVDSSMAIDRRLNAIWLKGSPERIARLKQEIAAIDIPVDSVILETELVELTETGARSIGIDLDNANGQIGVATFQTGQFIPPGVPAGKHLSSVALQAAIYAQIQKGQGRIVSKPRIAAQSGSTAKIITGDALPILTSITLSGVNGVSQQVQYVNVGVTLQIAPRVSSDGFVSSHVFSVVSSVSGYSQGYPTISQREAETSATVRDGDSFVIGGLTQEETLINRKKVPLLGSIPLLGRAFSNDKSTKSKTDLYIVITPHVVHRVAQGAGTQIAPPLPPDLRMP